MYVVSMDKDSSYARVHRTSCPHYIDRKRNAPTWEWSGEFETLKEACNFLATLKRSDSDTCGKCIGRGTCI